MKTENIKESEPVNSDKFHSKYGMTRERFAQIMGKGTWEHDRPEPSFRKFSWFMIGYLSGSAVLALIRYLKSL